MRIISLIAAVLLASSATAQDGKVQGEPIVLACVDKEGKLLSAEIWRSSGFPELDQAALKVANAATFKPGEDRRGKKRAGCVKFKVRFEVRDGQVVPAQN